MKSYEELQEENRLLRKKLAEYQHSEDLTGVNENKDASERFLQQNQRHKHYEGNSYAAFLFSNFRSTWFYRIYRRLYKIFKPTIVLVRVIRWLMIFLTMIQASVVLLFVVAVSLVMLPIFLLAFAVIWIRILYERRRLHDLMKKAFEGQRVLIFFSSDTQSEFFDGNMRTLLPSYTVIVVQEGGNLFGDSYTDTDGKKKRFLTAYRAAPQYYRIRRHYYFYLRKHYFDKAASIAMIY